MMVEIGEKRADVGVQQVLDLVKPTIFRIRGHLPDLRPKCVVGPWHLNDDTICSIAKQGMVVQITDGGGSQQFRTIPLTSIPKPETLSLYALVL